MRDLKKQCEVLGDDFANKNVGHYAQRNQSDLKKISYDYFIGKMGEWVVYYYLMKQKKEYHPDNQPLMYLLQQANWDADLENNKYKIAVKTCKQGKYGLNWSFSIRDHILQKYDENYLVFFVEWITDSIYRIHSFSNTKKLIDSNAYDFDENLDKIEFKNIKFFVRSGNIIYTKKFKSRVKYNHYLKNINEIIDLGKDQIFSNEVL